MKDKWKDDSIQFPRLLAEIDACGLTPHQFRDIRESMDITDDELDELFDRADTAWGKAKGNI